MQEQLEHQTEVKTPHDGNGIPTVEGNTAGVPYWNSYVKEDGLSYIAQCKFSNFTLAAFGPGIKPNFMDWLPVGSLEPLLTVMPIGFNNSGHTAPNPVQLTVILSGKVQWTWSGGQKSVLTTGEMMLEEEHLAKEGHVTTNIGDAPASVLVMMATDIPVEFLHDQHQPCRFEEAIARWNTRQAALGN
jgi:hypothetical protein